MKLKLFVLIKTLSFGGIREYSGFTAAYLNTVVLTIYTNQFIHSAGIRRYILYVLLHT